MKTPIRCRAGHLHALQKFLTAAVRYSNRPDFETAKPSEIEAERQSLCDGYIFLNDQGINLMTLEVIRLYAATPQDPNGPAWAGFLRYLERNNYRLDIIPDQPKTDPKQP